MKIKMVLPLKVESLNKVGPYRHWRIYYDYKKKWIDAIGFTLQHIEEPEQVRRKIRITSHRKRLLDSDNLIGGCKPIVDAIKKRGYIVDDSPQWVNIRYEQKMSDTESTTILIS